VKGFTVLLGLILLAACTPDDESRPGFPRTPRTPLAGAPYPYVAAEDAGLSSDDVWLFKERLYSRVVARHVIGSEILVVRDGKIVLHQAMGWADRDELIPLERNSIFRIASMTKPFAGMATLILADEGRIDIDAAVADYLPSFDNELSGGITVSQLLTHRSGFVQGGDPPGYAAEPTLLEAIELVGERGPTFPPGDRFIYSNLNSEALGAVVAKASGGSVERFLDERILAPLELDDTHTGFDPGVSWADRVASSYRRWGAGRWERWWNPARPHDRNWFSPAGDLFGTAFDYARFLQLWLDLGSVDGARLLAERTAVEALDDPAASDSLPARTRWYGMHWEIYAPPKAAGGLPVFGHRGATGTVGLAIPESRTIVVYLTNSSETDVVDEVIGTSLELFRD
jgi:CubicO group peptidase (beta-lactamase class C family)